MQEFMEKLKDMDYPDAYHITKPSEDGSGGYRAMEMALKDQFEFRRYSLC